MASLNLDLNYFDHSKAMRLEARLGNGSDVLPIRLWTYVGRHKPENGCLEMLAEELERICRWWGEKGAMVAAMLEIGFIERKGEFYQVHDWLDHCGHLSAFKKRAVKANKIRWSAHRKSRTPTRTPRSNVKESPSSTVQDVTKQFITIWQEYPRKLGKDEAERHFKAQVKTPQDLLDIRKAIDNFKADLKKKGTEEEFVPHGSTWFNKRWRDWITYAGVTLPKPLPPTPRAPDPVMSDVDRDQSSEVLGNIMQMIKPRPI